MVTSTTRALRPPTVVKDSRGYRVFRVANATVLVLVCLVMLYPFANVIAQSFSSEAYISRGEVSFWPPRGSTPTRTAGSWRTGCSG